jgi:uncharacterized membrane protein YhiD involved in acid resistance
MNDQFYKEMNAFSDLGASVSTGNLILCLLISWILSTIVAKVYQYTYREASFSPAFMQTLVICGMVIGAVMLIIGSNIARAFSLVGALSIIRFRNAVKDPRDVAFIFLVMAIGMSCGTRFYQVAIALTVVSCAAILSMDILGFGSNKFAEKIVKIQSPIINDFENFFKPVLSGHAKRFSLVSAERTQMGTEIELTYTMQVARSFNIEKLISDLSRLNKDLSVQVLGTNFSYDL